LGSANDWVTVAAGIGYSLGLKADSVLRAWGAHFHGELGLGDTTYRLSPTQLERFNAPRVVVIPLN